MDSSVKSMARATDWSLTWVATFFRDLRGGCTCVNLCRCVLYMGKVQRPHQVAALRATPWSITSFRTTTLLTCQRQLAVIILGEQVRRLAIFGTILGWHTRATVPVIRSPIQLCSICISTVRESRTSRKPPFRSPDALFFMSSPISDITVSDLITWHLQEVFEEDSLPRQTCTNWVHLHSIAVNYRAN